MKIDFFPFTAVDYLSKRDVLFQTEEKLFNEFLSNSFNIESFANKIEERKKFPVNRNLLVEVLEEQYKNAGISDYPQENIRNLKSENTFTVITAHQPSLLTGPLYFIYKIISVINLAEKLNNKYTESNIIPVFILGSEDHDFEEINHLSLFGKTITWNKEKGGAVGRMEVESLMPTLDEVYEILGISENTIHLKQIIDNAFQNADNYNVAMLRLVHELFKKYNLVILSMDNLKLKKAFQTQINEEIFNQPSQKLIQNTQDLLESINVKPQAHAREINFFYLQEGRRDRIIQNGKIFEIKDTDLEFTRNELQSEIENHPERFSPNVIMRPIFQELILPNLAYLGGGGEIAYWTERKSQFEHFKISFPILVRRNSVLWITKAEQKQLDKFLIPNADIFKDKEEWVKNYIRSQASAELEFSTEFENFNKAFDSLNVKAAKIDSSLANSIKGNQVKQFKIFEQLSSRLIRAEKEKHEREINKIKKLSLKLFPEGGLQERKDNFLSFYLKYGDSYFDILKKNLDPFDQSFVVISEPA